MMQIRLTYAFVVVLALAGAAAVRANDIIITPTATHTLVLRDAAAGLMLDGTPTQMIPLSVRTTYGVPLIRDGVSAASDCATIEISAAALSNSAAISVDYLPTYVRVWRAPDGSGILPPGTAVEAPAGSGVWLYAEAAQRCTTDVSLALTVVARYAGEARSATASVPVSVAEEICMVLADGENSSQALGEYLLTNACDVRRTVAFLRGPRRFYAVHIVRDQAGFQRALGTEGCNIVYDGHANFGLGPSFMAGRGGCRRLSDFMNTGPDYVGVDWSYLCYDQGNPDLEIDRSEYGDDPSTPEWYDPWMYYVELPDGAEALRYAASDGPGRIHMRLYRRGFRRSSTMHMTVSNCLVRLVVRGGADDMPVQRWRRLFIKSCYSGQYFFHAFNHGTLFYSVNEVISPYTAAAFVQAVVNEESDRGICLALNDAENDYRPIEFPMTRYTYHAFGAR